MTSNRELYATALETAAPADAPGPQPPDSASGGAVCTCGRAPQADRPGFCVGGHPLPGHGARLSRRHGLYDAEMADVLAEARVAFLAASVADDGGEAEVPTRRRSLHEYRARLHVHVAQLSDAIERHGLFDRRHRLRATWLQRLEGLIDRARAIDTTLGLARRSRPVESASDIIREYAAREESQP